MVLLLPTLLMWGMGGFRAGAIVWRCFFDWIIGIVRLSMVAKPFLDR